MKQVYPDSTLLPTLLRSLPANLHYWIFTNDVTPALTDVLGTYSPNTGINSPTVPSSAFTLTGVIGHIARAVAADIAFTNSSGGPLTFFGYFVSTGTTGSAPSGDLVLSARFDDVSTPIVDGGIVTVTPTIALTQK